MIPRAAAAAGLPLRSVCCGLALFVDGMTAAEVGTPRGAPLEWRPNKPPVLGTVALLGGMGRRKERVRVSELPAMGQMALGLRPRDLNFAAKRSQELRDPVVKW